VEHSSVFTTRINYHGLHSHRMMSRRVLLCDQLQKVAIGPTRGKIRRSVCLSVYFVLAGQQFV